ncbi:hypothetical protein DSO57_1021350 [Entomophthora muscae]|uniref:Uncharacterized protein n=1 Tax=Entomophthora muscae TaxID=34485 RepID=A0ACC2TEH5_9FUNG|nr:hypothetical protein DSO57_1021350 [Entomophthora muscae]
MFTPILPRPGTSNPDESPNKITCLPVTGGIASHPVATDKDHSNILELSGSSPISEEAPKFPTSSPRKESVVYEASVLKPSSPDGAKEFVPLENLGYPENFPASNVESKSVLDRAPVQAFRVHQPKPLSSGLLDLHLLGCSPGLLDPKFLASILKSQENLSHPTKNQLITLLNNIRGKMPEFVIHISPSQPTPYDPVPRLDDLKLHPGIAPLPLNWDPYHNQLHSNLPIGQTNHLPAATSYPIWSNIPVDNINWKPNAYHPNVQPWPQAFSNDMFNHSSSKQLPQEQNHLKSGLGSQSHIKAPTTQNSALNDSARPRKVNASKKDSKSTTSIHQQNDCPSQLASALVPQGTKSTWNAIGEKRKKCSNSIDGSIACMRLSEALALIEAGQLEERFTCHGLTTPDVCPYPDCGFQFDCFENLQAHIGSHNPSRPFECPDCSSSFHRGQDLLRHRRIHLQLRPFKCPNCLKAFGRRDAQQRHTNRLNCAGSVVLGYGSELNTTQL